MWVTGGMEDSANGNMGSIPVDVFGTVLYWCWINLWIKKKKKKHYFTHYPFHYTTLLATPSTYSRLGEWYEQRA